MEIKIIYKSERPGRILKHPRGAAYIEDGKFCFSGLHQDIMVYRAAAGEVELVATNGVWIGILDEIGMKTPSKQHMSYR